MNTIQIQFDYNLKWVFKEYPNYAITSCRKVINIHRGTIVKKVVNGCSIGWWVAGNFIPQSKINNFVELINQEKLPY